MTVHSLNLNASIMEHVLHPNENLGLVMWTPKETIYDVYVFKVMRVHPIDIQVVEEFKDKELSPGNQTGFIRLTRDAVGGSQSDDYLDSIVKGRPYRIVHFAFGVGPSDKLDTRMAIVYASKDYKACFPEEGFELSVKPDYITPRLSPFEDPKVAAEFLVWDGVTILVNIINKNTETIRPAVRMLGAVYEVIPINRRDLIERMIGGKIPCRFESVLGVVTSRPDLIPSEWGEPYKLTKEQLEVVM